MSNRYDFTVGQVGARIILAIVRRDPISKLTSPLNVSAATMMDITVKKPDGSANLVYNAVFTPVPDGAGDGSDGLIEAVTVAATELDVPGTYQTQAHIVIPGEDGFTQVGTFTVGANL